MGFLGMFNKKDELPKLPDQKKEEIIRQMKAYLELESMKGGNKQMSRDIKNDDDDFEEEVEEEPEEELRRPLAKKPLPKKEEPKERIMLVTQDQMIGMIYDKLVYLTNLIEGQRG